MRTFVDTNIVLYAYDQREPEKSAIAREIVSDLWRTREGLLSTQVLQELYVNLTRNSGSSSSGRRRAPSSDAMAGGPCMPSRPGTSSRRLISSNAIHCRSGTP